MPTLYNDIENLFLGEIKDLTFLDYEALDREEILDGYLMKAIVRFKACQIDLTDKDDIVRQFNNTLTDEICYIFAVCMKKPWLSDKIYNLELLEQRLSPKDWKQTSQAEHLTRLLDLKKDLEADISKMIVDYTIYNVKVGETK
jgi:hypothetical protein